MSGFHKQQRSAAQRKKTPNQSAAFSQWRCAAPLATAPRQAEYSTLEKTRDGTRARERGRESEREREGGEADNHRKAAPPTHTIQKAKASREKLQCVKLSRVGQQL